MGGQIIDASIIEAPRRGTRSRRKRISRPDASETGRRTRRSCAEGPRRALDAEAGPAQAEARRHADDGDRDAGLRLQEPCRRRPPSPVHPHLVGDRRRALRRPRTAGLLDRSNTGSSVWADTAYRSAKNEAHRQGRAGLEGPLPQAAGKPMPSRNSAPTPPARGSDPASSMSSPTRSTAWACSSARSASPEPRQNRPRQHRLQHAPASVLGDGNGRDSVAQRAQPAISERQTHSHDRPAQPPAADDPFRRTSNAGK